MSYNRKKGDREHKGEFIQLKRGSSRATGLHNTRLLLD